MNSSMLSHSNIKYGSEESDMEHKNVLLDSEFRDQSDAISIESESTVC